MRIFRDVSLLMMVAALGALPAVTYAQAQATNSGPASAPANTAYEQLPTTWDQPQPTTRSAETIEQLPPADPSTSLAYPSSAQPWSGPTSQSVAPTPLYSAPPSAYPVRPTAYAAPGGAACGPQYVDVAIGAYPPYSFWFATAELTALHAHYDNGLFTLNDPSSSAAPRLIFGWESPRGLGLRARFWWLNDHQVAAGPLPDDEFDVQIQTRRFDFEVYRRFSFDGSSLAVGGGLTNAAFRWKIGPNFQPIDEGTGVEFFGEARHLLWVTPRSESAIVARGRFAALIGQWRDDSGFGGFRISGNSNMEIIEAAFGWEDKIKFDHCDLVLTSLMEAQTWDTTYNGNLGLLGVTVSAGLRW